LGWASILGFIIYEKFRNIDVIKNAKCPVLIVHGKKDNLIPVQHSMDLYENCNQPCYLFIPLKMDHNEFQIEEDLCQPIKAFIRKIEERIAVQQQVHDTYDGEDPIKGEFQAVARNLEAHKYYSDLSSQINKGDPLELMHHSSLSSSDDLMSPIRKEKKQKNYLYKMKNFELTL